MTESNTNSTPKRWRIAPLIPSHISRELNEYPPFLRQLLFNRGIVSAEQARAYLSDESPTDTNPLNLKDMPKAVALIHDAISNQQKIAIYGDYDADGVTSSSVLYEFLTKLGAKPRAYIPNRFDEGYGLNNEAMEQLHSEGIDLIITVDCGIRSIEQVALAKQLGMKVIVSDHHLPGKDVPEADAVIDPHQEGDFYPYKMLAGVGIAYKIVQAYLQSYPKPEIDPRQWLDLVSIGTVVDVAPLNGENRAMVKAGLNLMRKTQRQGLYSLIQASGIKMEKLNSGHLGFAIGPRLNAAGRMDSAYAAFELLTTKDLAHAGQLAQELDNLNSQRKEITHNIQDSVIHDVNQGDPNVPIIISVSEDYEEGVVGLAAGRVAEAFYKPAIIGRIEDGKIKASCRSIPEFNIVEALDECEDLLTNHGGHAAAAGLGLEVANFEAFRERIIQIANEKLAGMELMPELSIDYEIDLARLKPEHIPGILSDIANLEPTGTSNPDTVFCSRNCRLVNARPVSDGRHLKMVIAAGTNQFDAIAFNQGHWLENMPKAVDLAYAIEINEWNGRQTLQFNVKDLKASG
ncbi:MAG: single-stranded-DNA-specific exonuclease RecJ [Anaerolineaceae bacterium]|nr:single-stranded-DNA-specific exonuclease RecJ [Anaerolineaceae bacterium]